MTKPQASKRKRSLRKFRKQLNYHWNLTIEKMNKINEDGILGDAMNVIDDYLNAGSKESRAKASIKAKSIYKRYYGKEYKNRNER